MAIKSHFRHFLVSKKAITASWENNKHIYRIYVCIHIDILCLPIFKNALVTTNLLYQFAESYTLFSSINLKGKIQLNSVSFQLFLNMINLMSTKYHCNSEFASWPLRKRKKKSREKPISFSINKCIFNFQKFILCYYCCELLL